MSEYEITQLGISIATFVVLVLCYAELRRKP